MYSACQSTDCRCTGWKTPEENRHKDVESNYCPKFSDECRNVNCKHSLDDHISHLGYITDEQINELLGAIVDVENLFMSMHREQDEDTKKVYYYLFRVRNCVTQTVFALTRIECFISFPIDFSVAAAMHFDATAGRHQWAVGRSTIWVAIHCESRYEFRFLQVSTFIAAGVSDYDRSGQNFLALLELLEFRAAERSLSAIDQRGCVVIQNQLYAMVDVLSRASLL